MYRGTLDQPLLKPILVGLADKAVKRGLFTDLLGITTSPFLPVYPCSIDRWVAIVALPCDRRLNGANGRILFRDLRHAGATGWIDLNLRNLGLVGDQGPAAPVLDEIVAEQPLAVHGPALESLPGTWRFLGVPGSSHMLIPMRCPSLVLMEPGGVEVVWQIDGTEAVMGQLAFGFIEAAPLSVGEIRALLARPEQHRVLRFDFECRKCGQELKLYETIDEESIQDLPALASMTRLASAPGVWCCNCGASQIDTRWARAAVPHLFRQPPTAGDGEVSLVGAYQSSRVGAILSGFRALIQRAPAEEEAQKYLEQHPIFWGFLAPKHIKHKPPILTRFAADFGIVSANKVLYFVEIEKPHTRLLNRKQGKSAEVQKAFDQVRDWRSVISAHRGAVLDMLELSSHAVKEIRFLIIAGMDSGEAASLRTELASDTGLLTFEELAGHVAVLQAQMAHL